MLEMRPNCGGELIDRPARAPHHHAQNPHSTARKFKGAGMPRNASPAP